LGILVLYRKTGDEVGASVLTYGSTIWQLHGRKILEPASQGGAITGSAGIALQIPPTYYSCLSGAELLHAALPDSRAAIGTECHLKLQVEENLTKLNDGVLAHRVGVFRRIEVGVKLAGRVSKLFAVQIKSVNRGKLVVESLEILHQNILHAVIQHVLDSGEVFDRVVREAAPTPDRKKYFFDAALLKLAQVIGPRRNGWVIVGIEISVPDEGIRFFGISVVKNKVTPLLNPVPLTSNVQSKFYNSSETALLDEGDVVVGSPGTKSTIASTSVGGHARTF
jgi:hypothetical protein